MSRIDLVRLRKRAGMSQRELADRLQVRPSFLSAIENGKSRIPEEKLDKLKSIFELDSLEGYMIGENADTVVPPHSHSSDQNDILASLLNRFHELAHRNDGSLPLRDAETEARIDFLEKRNDRLSDRIDGLLEKVEALREENMRLRELLVKNGIHY